MHHVRMHRLLVECLTQRDQSSMQVAAEGSMNVYKLIQRVKSIKGLQKQRSNVPSEARDVSAL